jgi:PAS domain S-box-containing protein
VRPGAGPWTILDAAPNAIVGVDGDGRIVYVNAQVEATFGYQPDELLGEPVSVLVPEHMSSRHDAHRRRFMETPVARPMGIGLDLSALHKDGREFPVEISLSPIETADGVQVFATIIDITARRRAAFELLQAQKLESVGRLAGGIAHDFNNILFAIQGYSELIEDDAGAETGMAPDIPEIIKSARAIREATRRGSGLTQQLLTFSRQQVVIANVIDPRDALVAIQPMLARLIGENVRLAFDLNNATGHIRIDPGQLDQIIVNLVVNARDAMPSGGTVTVETANVTVDEPAALRHFEVAAGRYVVISVSDTGVGMDVETQARVFEPFFTTKDQGRGTGLGLATTYGIVRQAGGHIWLYSEPGQGSVFKLYFPRVDEQASPEIAATPPPPLSEVGGTVLVVEDETAVRDVTSRVFARAGIRVVACANPSEALSAADELGDDLGALVTDVIMPNGSGIELADAILARHPDVGIVLLSGYTADTLNLERLTARGARFISKPAAGTDLLAAVRDVVPHRG